MVMAEITITGAAGFAGSHITDAAKAAGHDVIEVDTYHSDGSVGWASPECKRGDVADMDFMRPLIEGRIVINAAALVSVPYGEVIPHAYWRTNATAVHGMLRLGAARFLQLSTSEIWDGTRAPYRDTDPPCPITNYGASKAAAEMAVRGFGGDAHIVRLFNLFGPRQFPRAIVGKMCRAALGQIPARFGDPEAKRAFLYAPWVAGQIVKMAEDASLPRVVQLASDDPITIGNLWVALHVPGADVKDVWRCPECMRSDERNVKALWGRSTDGWDTPKLDLDGLDATLDWWRANPDCAPHHDYQ